MTASGAPLPDADGWYRLDRDIDPAVAAALGTVPGGIKLKLSHIRPLTVRLARRLQPLREVECLWLWSPVTRRALRHVVALPGLRQLDVLQLLSPAMIGGFERASRLEIFRAPGMSEADLLQVARCPTLRELGMQGARLTPRALDALLELPGLQALDAEATAFDDRMARRLCRSDTLTALELGGARLTGRGLRHLSALQQLRALDLWATRVTDDDLDALAALPALEYLSLGDHEGMCRLDPDRVVALLLRLPALKRVWLDGVRLRDGQAEALRSKIGQVRLD